MALRSTTAGLIALLLSTAATGVIDANVAVGVLLASNAESRALSAEVSFPFTATPSQ